MPSPVNWHTTSPAIRELLAASVSPVETLLPPSSTIIGAPEKPGCVVPSRVTWSVIAGNGVAGRIATGPEPIRNWIVSAPGEALAALMASRSVQAEPSHRPSSESPAEITVKTAARAAAGIERHRARPRERNPEWVDRLFFKVPPVQKEIALP